MPKSKDTLDRININTPCEADWDEMVGNDIVRFCKHCNLSVHNLSEMTRREAMRLVLDSNGQLCARYVRRPDGKIQTTDLVLHQIQKARRRASRLAAGAFTAALSLSSGIVAAAQTPANAPAINETNAAAVLKQGRIKITYTGSVTLTGTVIDPNGAVVAGANVRLVNEQTGTERQTTTNDEGLYLLEGVDEGSFTLKIAASGFATAEVHSINLQAGEEKVVDQQLSIATEVAMGGAVAFIAPEEPLLAAVLREDVAEVKGLLAAGADVNVLDKDYNMTPLAQAVSQGHRELVKLLLSAGADVNARNREGLTPLMEASTQADVEVLRYLLDAGAKIELRDDEGKTALHHAVDEADAEVLQALLDAGASVDARDEAGRTALMRAAETGEEDDLVVLLKAGASVNLRDEEGKTALGRAKENGSGEAVDILTAYGGVE
ncbi:MAG: ankyrin repeat domain-containing protein [Acidobacteria bacterium]|nr:ankyrin repeat domain-containing protein [Acidobacteriota bacterium]